MGTENSLPKKLLWFVGLWFLGVLTVTLVGFAIKLSLGA
jgi:hypothetical protein